MADHIMKKYTAKVEKTIYVVEELEIICETEKEAEELLDDYCCDEHSAKVKLVDIEEQETKINMRWVDESTVLSVDEFMDYKDGLH
tara:strand:+ start:2428 stop:2685 length:258 start_codon:yes stop_codon:yes gene_type:complete